MGYRAVLEAYLASPGAEWIVRRRRLEPAAFRHIARRMRDGLRVGVAARVEDGHGRVLLVRMNPRTGWTSRWTTPGGGVDPGESFRHAILREIREETGGRVRDLRLWRVYHETLVSAAGDLRTWDFLQYTARWASGIPRSRVPEEISEARWFSRLPVNMEFRNDWLRRPRGAPPDSDTAPRGRRRRRTRG